MPFSGQNAWKLKLPFNFTRYYTICELYTFHIVCDDYFAHKIDSGKPIQYACVCYWYDCYEPFFGFHLRWSDDIHAQYACTCLLLKSQSRIVTWTNMSAVVEIKCTCSVMY